ncbi:hypothetical protein EJB05_00738, partial [Eragrostis curvula]
MEENEEEEEEELDFQFMDAHAASPAAVAGLCSPFEVVAAELSAGAVVDVADEDGGGPATAVQELMSRIEYERKVSASLYALNGVSECLKMRLGGAGAAMGDQLSGLREACRKKQHDSVHQLQQHQEQEPAASETTEVCKEACSGSDGGGSGSSVTEESGVDGDVLWSSLDLAPLC